MKMQSKLLCLISAACLAVTLTVLPAANAADKSKTEKAKVATTAPVDPYAEVQPATETLDLTAYQRIREEGLNHSHVMDFAYRADGRHRPAPHRLAQPQEGQRVDARHADQDRPGKRAS
jgi:hypothetical protein